MPTYIDILENAYIKILNEKHSTLAQKILFKLGYEWRNSGTNYVSIPRNSCYIFIDSNDMKLTYNNSSSIYTKLIHLKDLKQLI